MIGSICISLIAFNQLKLVPRLLLDKLRLVASLQGSLQGLLLFLLYVNDLYRSCDKLSFYSFANDSNLLLC